jgi:REP element-mobilizing transposase RayT
MVRPYRRLTGLKTTLRVGQGKRYLLTWNTYGTWLPGDERGWVKYGRGRQLPSPSRKQLAEMLMTERPCVLDEEQRAVVEETITRHCAIRGWKLHAVKCQSKHVHAVITANLDPDEIRDQLKAWCTRRLKELEHRRRAKQPGLVNTPIREKWWAEGGSGKFINNEDGLEAAILYVIEGQDRPREEYRMKEMQRRKQGDQMK